MKPLMVAAPSEATDSQLVVAAQQGSDMAFEALFRRYRDRITAYVRSIVMDHGRAEDIVQDVFMSALRSLRSTEREVLFKPWVYEIAKNACIDHIRRARRGSEVSIDSEDFSPADEGRMSIGVASTDAAFSAREDLDTLRMAFDDLPDAQREVLVSRELEGLSYDKISTRTGLSRSAVESMLFRARRTLKDGFDDIATGERCQRMQTVMVHLTDGRIGLRQERRLVRHLDACAACRREAIALGLDDLVLQAPSRTRSVLSRVAGFLPLPAFFRRRWSDGSSLLGSAGQSGAAEGVSLAGKAAVVLAAAAIAGGGAGVAHKTGVIGAAGGSTTGAAADQGSSGAGGSSKGGGSGAAKGGRRRRWPAGRRRRRERWKWRRHDVARRRSSAGPDGAAGPRGPHGDAGSPLNGIGGQAGAAGGAVNGAAGGVTNGAGGAIDNTVNGVGGTVNGVGGAVGGTVQGVGGAVQEVGGAVGGPVGGTVSGVGGAVSGLGGTVTGTVNGVTGTVNGVTGGITQPSQSGSSRPRVPLLTP